MSPPVAPPFAGSPRVERAALGAAAGGGLLLLGGAFLAPERLAHAYLTAWATALTTALGALFFLMITHAMRAGWPTVVRPLVEAIVGTLPVLALLGLPLLLGLQHLYPWLQPGSIADEHTRDLVQRKLPYLDLGFFLGRAAFFFAVWIVVGHLLRRWSRAQEHEPSAAHRRYVASAALLPLVALTFSFAAFDWLMSLTPAWYSTMYPVYVFAGGFLAGLALLSLLTAAADRAGLLPGLGPSHHHALGRLLLAFVIFWAYVAFFQLLFIWMGNEPEEIRYYLDRLTGGFAAETVALGLCQFVLPFFLLLPFDLKRRRGFLAAISAWLLAAHYLDVHWLVMPTAPAGRAVHGLLDLGALLAVGGLSAAFVARRLRGQVLLPIHDPELPRALRYESR